MNKDIDLLIKKIEEESKLIKGDASKNEMQEILKEKLVIERERDNLLLENKQLKDKIRYMQQSISFKMTSSALFSSSYTGKKFSLSTPQKS